jgi:hypothetical protein
VNRGPYRVRPESNAMSIPMYQRQVALRPQQQYECSPSIRHRANPQDPFLRLNVALTCNGCGTGLRKLVPRGLYWLGNPGGKERETEPVRVTSSCPGEVGLTPRQGNRHVGMVQEQGCPPQKALPGR